MRTGFRAPHRVLHAVDDDPLSGVSLDSTREEVAAVLADRALATARLTGTFAPPWPLAAVAMAAAARAISWRCAR
jgi:hypothetical protein